MKENNEVVQGTDTALKALRANKSPCDVGVVLSVLKDTKKLNAGIALVCLGSYLEDGMITQEQLERIRVLADRGKNTPIAKESETNDVEYIEQSIAYLEEYIKEQGV